MSSAFSGIESEVRRYSRTWPTTFATALGSWVRSVDDEAYLDFFAGAGSLNYGHNDPALVNEVTDYLARGGIVSSLDMDTVAKRQFLEAFESMILRPRMLTYRVQFTGPSGTDAVEAAIRLARKATRRNRIVCISGSYHGMTLGARAVSEVLGPSDDHDRDETWVGIISHELDDPEGALASIERQFQDRATLPAAVIVECVQGEGGARPSSTEFLIRLGSLCEEHETILIADEVQTGCGRTGPFFAFEAYPIRPSLVCLSKSLSGIGLPMAAVLIAPALDLWDPGEHAGTFRGNDLGFVGGAAAIHRWWAGPDLEETVNRKADSLQTALHALADEFEVVSQSTGRGLLQCLHFADEGTADAVVSHAFKRGLLVETCGRRARAVKLTPPLTIEDEDLERGVAMLTEALADVSQTKL